MLPRPRSTAEVVLLTCGCIEACFFEAGDFDHVPCAANTREFDRISLRDCVHPQQASQNQNRQDSHGLLHLKVDDGGVLNQHVGAGVLNNGRKAR